MPHGRELAIALLQPTLVDWQDNADALDKLDVKSSAEEIGIRPADFIQAIMADPELSKVCLLSRQLHQTHIQQSAINPMAAKMFV